MGHRNMGFVVNNKDPLSFNYTTNAYNATFQGELDADGGVTGNVGVTEMEWVEFNQVNFELDFKDKHGELFDAATEVIEGGSGTIDTSSGLGYGAIMMKHSKDDEKAVTLASDIFGMKINTGISVANIDFIETAPDAEYSTFGPQSNIGA